MKNMSSYLKIIYNDVLRYAKVYFLSLNVKKSILISVHIVYTNMLEPNKFEIKQNQSEHSFRILCRFSAPKSLLLGVGNFYRV